MEKKQMYTIIENENSDTSQQAEMQQRLASISSSYNLYSNSQQPNGQFAYPAPVIPTLAEPDHVGLQTEYERSWIRMEERRQLLAAEAESELKVATVKANLRAQLLAARETYRRKRENRTIAIIEDSDGYLRSEVKYGSEDDFRISSRLCDLRKFRICAYHSYETDSFRFVLEINAEGLRHPIGLCDRNCDAKTLEEKLRAENVHINAPVRDRNEVLKRLLKFFRDRALEIEIPFATGWVMTSEGFRYTREKDLTFLEKWSRANYNPKDTDALCIQNKNPRTKKRGTAVQKISLILSSLAVNTMILQSWGIRLDSCIFLTGESSEIDDILERLSPDPRIIDVATSLKDAKNLFENTYGEAIVLRMPTSKMRYDKKFTKLREFVMEMSRNQDKCIQSFLAGPIFDDELEGANILEIFLTDFSDSLIADVEVVPEIEDFALIKEKILEFGELDDRRKALYAAVACMYGNFKKTERLEEYFSLFILCEKICNSWVSIESSSVESTFCRCIFQAVRKSECSNMYHFDDANDHLLMSSETFREIVSPLLTLISMRKLKGILSRANILLLGSNNLLTRKVIIENETGIVRKNFVVLNARSITQKFDGQLIELSAYINAIKEEGNAYFGNEKK